MSVNLFSNPIITLNVLRKVIFNFIYEQLSKISYLQILIVIILSLLYFVPQQFDGTHNIIFKQFNQIIIFSAWWIGLGVASSIGLGSGLHTFVLYLGPHIAKIALYTNQCNSLPTLLPSKYDFQNFGECINGDGVTFIETAYFVALECFLWGFGTALGELPPYFVSKAAALVNQKNNELDEQLQENSTFMGKAKNFLFQNIQKYAFITILISASIPNPLFDLAGISCGHFLVPFYTFFGATFIGKAIIKVSIQSVFVILLFNKQNMDQIKNIGTQYFPQYESNIKNFFDKQQDNLINQNKQEESGNIIGDLWGYFITLMILYFVVSTINSLVNNYIEEENSILLQKDKSQVKKSKSKRE